MILPSRHPRLLRLAGATLVALLALAPNARAARRPVAAPVALFDSPGEAMQWVLRGPPPRVIALGEFHEVEGAPKVRTSLQHFRDEILPLLAPLASDLVLETWVTQGNCGKEEKAVVGQVEETTQRPQSVETDLVKLIKRSRALGVEPHILEMSCPSYRALLDDKGEVDFTRLLATIARLLEDQVERIRKERGPRETRSVLVYGGAVHNDLAPARELRAFSYAPSLSRKTRDSLVSVNLFVPEFIERSAYLKAERWYARLASVPPGKTAVVTKGPRSFVIVFPRGVPVEDPGPQPAATAPSPPPDPPAAPRPAAD